MKAIVIKATSQHTLQQKLDEVLQRVDDSFVDLKIAGSFNGKEEEFVVIVLHK